MTTNAESKKDAKEKLKKHLHGLAVKKRPYVGTTVKKASPKKKATSLI